MVSAVSPHLPMVMPSGKAATATPRAIAGRAGPDGGGAPGDARIDRRAGGHGARPEDVVDARRGACRRRRLEEWHGTDAGDGRDDRAGEDLDRVVQLIHGGVIEAPGCCNLRLDLGPCLLRLDQRAIGLQLRVGFQADE